MTTKKSPPTITVVGKVCSGGGTRVESGIMKQARIVVTWHDKKKRRCDENNRQRKGWLIVVSFLVGVTKWIQLRGMISFWYNILKQKKVDARDAQNYIYITQLDNVIRVGNINTNIYNDFCLCNAWKCYK